MFVLCICAALGKVMIAEIKNKKAEFRYHLLDEFIAGIELTGSEIKSIRAAKANITDAYCRFKGSDLVIINMFIAPYDNAGYSQHKDRRERRLLLNRTELNKLSRKLKDAGITIVPVSLFINEKGWAKLKIAMAKGKNAGDKRHSLKEKDLKREQQRSSAE